MRKEPGARRLGADFTALFELGGPMISCSLAEIQENVHVAKNFGIHRLFENIWFCEMVSLWAEKKSAEVSHKQVKCAVAVVVRRPILQGNRKQATLFELSSLSI